MFKKKSARDQSKEITDGDSKEHHIGKMSIEVLDQEITSLKNTKPMFRDDEWRAKFNKLSEVVAKIHEPRQHQGFTNRLNSCVRVEY